MTSSNTAGLAAPAFARAIDPRRSIAPAFLMMAIGLWLVLPPLMFRDPLVSLAFALAALSCAILHYRERPVSAVVAGTMAVISGAVSVWVTSVSASTLETVVSWPGLFAATVVVATPITFAALGGVISERSGVMNIGLEGMMLSGAFFAVLGAAATGNWLLGLLAGVASGCALALLFAVFAVVFGGNQVVAGLAVNFLALGTTGFGYVLAFGVGGAPMSVPRIPELTLPLEWLGPWGEVLSHLNLMVWLCLVAAVAVSLFLFRTVAGMRLRAIGEKPAAADTAGISVVRTRVLAVVSSGGLAAMGGAFLSIGFVGGFNEGMTGGRGYIALAAMIFGAWRPFGALGAALLFGFAQAFVLRVPDLTPATSALFQTLPYVLTIIAVIGLVGRATAPAAVGIPYRRRER